MSFTSIFVPAIGLSMDAWDHRIAFVLLVGLGLKMLHEAWPASGSGRTFSTST